MANLNCEMCGERFEAKRSDAKFCISCRKIRETAKFRRYEERNRTQCTSCGMPVERRSRLCQECDAKRREFDHRGAGNPNWHEGRSMSQGYIMVRVKEGSSAKGYGSLYRGEHILIWEAENGPIPKGWVVHHLNGVKTDNRLENLLATSRHHHHTHPREALVPYEERIKELERLLSDATAPTS